MEGSIVLKETVVNRNRVDFRFETTGRLQKYFRPEHRLFFEYNVDISEVPISILTIPFAANVMPLIWLTGGTLTVDELDQSFYECLDRVRTAYGNMYPHMAFTGTLTVGSIRKNEYVPEREAASLFSGGLDALTTYIRIRQKQPILITEYGWHEADIRPSRVWEADRNYAVQFAKNNGLDNILVQSNYGTFIEAGKVDQDFRKKLGDTWWHGLHHGLAIISAAIPAVFQLKAACIYIASSNSPLLQVTCASDPTVDNEIRFASGRVFHDAYELTRQDKVKVVVDYYASNPSSIADSTPPVQLRVCFKNEQNCCRCEKCLRTMMGIIAEGHDPAPYGFPVSGNLSKHIRESLDNEVKFFSDTFITIYWKIIQRRMKENEHRIADKELLGWFLDYDFAKQRKKMLLKYRVTRFFPILKRKIAHRLQRLFAA